METQRICPNCRKPLPTDVPLGLCPECLIKSGFPTETGPGGAGEAAGARFVPPPVEEIAQLFPQLEILGLIGKGGMGAVYKARQPMLDRIIALKVLPPAVAGDPGFAERFNREARALARLNHPNIVTVYDFGKAGDLHYLLMEFVDGTNLRQVEQAGRLSADQALTIVPKICEALQYAHDQGVVHRDIKPENILLDKSGRVKIADFGIAKMVGLGETDISLTGAKDVVGTPHYMAPEQIEKPQTVDHRADIYSLGVVFYEMLTGELPLGKFAAPSTKVHVDVRLDEVVLHTLEKEPSRRYQHASQVKSDVETITGAAGSAGKVGSFAAGQAASDKAILPALLLAFPFGLFGAHRFYAGKIGTAFLQLGAFGWCVLLIIACATLGRIGQPMTGILLGFSLFGCFIWAVTDWILILCKAFTDGQGRRMSHWLHPQNGNLKAGPSPMTGPPSSPPPGGAAPPDAATPPATATAPAAAAFQPPPLTPEKMPAAGTGMIAAPAVGLMVAALWKILSAAMALFFLAGWFSDQWLGAFKDLGIGSFSHWSTLASFSIVLFKVVPGLLILFGAFQMLRLRSYAWALTAAILSVVACSLIGLPMGIWALIVLARQDVRETFARQSQPQPVSTGIWPWLIGIATVICLIVIGVMATYLFVLREIDRTPHATVAGNDQSVAVARADISNDSSTRKMAIPAPPAPPVRIKAGSSKPFTDSDGNVWLPDQGFADGETAERPDLAIVNTLDPELYRTERYGMTSFSYPVPNGKYAVRLHFAETFDDITGPGKRVFTFIVEGHEFKDFDVWAEAGGAQRAFVQTVAVEVSDGRLNIYFIHQQQNPEINGIEILPAPPAAATPPATDSNSGVTMNISSLNGRVMIATSNGTLSADKVQLDTVNHQLTATASKIDLKTSPVPSVPPAPSVAPAPSAPPATASAAIPAPPRSAGTLSQPNAHREKTIGELSTSDPFQQDFNRTLPLSAQGRLRLDNVNGRIEIAGWDRNEVVIKALKHGKTQESVEAVRINVDSSPDEIVVHTELPPGESGFSWSRLWSGDWNRNDATVDYAIQVPQHARLKQISSVNGNIVIEAVSGDVEASTVNGRVQVQGAASSLKVSTVNGQVETELASLGGIQSVSLNTVNGAIEATLPANADAEVTADTVNGGMSSEFPELVVKKDFPLSKHLKGTLGHGGATVKATTVNGSIRFHRDNAAR
ncbi:MAG: protein kinase domain-containing protein [Limisphaerales bacterium]